MEQQPNNNSIKEKVLEAVKKGQLTMRPKWHFVLKTALAATGAVIILLALLYLASFIIFSFRQSGLWVAPMFGFKGIIFFLGSLPWFLLLFCVIFIVILELLVKKYSFTYKYPLMYSVLALMLLAVLGGLIVANTSMHGKLFESAQKNRLPVAGKFYRDFGDPKLKNMHQGIVIEVRNAGFDLKSRHEILNIIVTSKTRLPLEGMPQKNDNVAVFGEKKGQTVMALGVVKIKPRGGSFLLPLHPLPLMDQPFYFNGDEIKK